MPTDVPLLNDYKKSFVRKRLLQTFLAGLRLTGCPWYSVVAQLIVFLIPGFIAVPFITLASVLDTDQWQLHLVVGYGSSVILFSLLLQGMSACFRRKAALNAVSRIDTIVEPQPGQTLGGEQPRNLHRRQLLFLLDEDDSYSEGCCSFATWSSILPAKRHPLNILLHSILAGVVSSSCLAFLWPQNVQVVFTNCGLEVLWTIIGFCWFSVLLSLFAVIIGCPPETATFRALDTLEIGAMSRPIHVFILVSCPYVANLLKTNYQEDADPFSITLIQQVCYIALPCLPLVWFLGLLPPLEPLLFWFIEQTQIFALGGSASASPIRSVFYFFISILAYGLVFLGSSDLTWTLIWASLFGYILSLDWFSLLELGLDFIKSRLCNSEKVEYCNNQNSLSTDQRQSHHNDQALTTSNKSTSQSSFKIFKHSAGFNILKEILMHSLFFTLNVLITALIPTCDVTGASNNKRKENTTSNSYDVTARPQSSSCNNLLGWVAIATYIAFKLTNELQKVYLLYGLVRSPLYSTLSSNDLTLMIWYHLRALIFNFLVCLFLGYYFKCLVLGDAVLTDITPNTNWWWLEVLAIVRTSRWIWQNTECALIEFSFLHLMVTYAEPIFVPRYSGVGVAYFFENVTRPVQLLLLSFFRDRAKQIIEKIYFVTALSVSALEERASRRPYAGCLFQMNVIFSPIIFCIIVISSLFSTPLLTIFTLPVFFLAYPRPLRFWPGPITQAAPCQDSVYYEQLIPPLIHSVHHAVRAGKLGLQQAGNFLLARHEDRLAYIQIMEKGNGFLIYSAKGLELQETSCHSLEATRLDDIFQDAFERCTTFNHFAFHSVTPLASISVRTYSASRSALTGIIEAPDTLKLVAKTFIQTLVWYTVLKLSQNQNTELINVNETKGSNIEPIRRESKLSNTEPQVVLEPEADAIADLNPEPQDLIQVEEEITSEAHIDSTNLDPADLSPWLTSTETSPEQDRAGNVSQWARSYAARSATYRRPSHDSIPSILNSISGESENENEVDNIELPSLRRRGLLPPIQLSPDNNIFLPGHVNERTPRFRCRKSGTMEGPPKRSAFLATEPSDHFSFSSDLARKMAPPKSWVLLGSQFNYNIDNLEKDFPMEWLTFSLKSILLRQELDKRPTESDLKSLIKDKNYMELIRKIVLSCVSIVYDHGGFVSAEEIAAGRGPSLIAGVFSGSLQWTLVTDWMMSESPELYNSVILPAYRCAVKLALDQMIIGPFSTSLEVEENILEVYTSWHLGMEEDPAWQKAVLTQVPNLFTMSSVDATGRSGGRHLYRSHMLTLRECPVNIGRLNPEVVKGLWASLSLELLYFTNDDDERYSIQAEERLLRNLTVEVADPPLGYSIYASKLIRHGLEYF